MALEAVKATPQGVEHRYDQFRVVTILNQLLNDLTLLGDVSLAFRNVPIDLHQVFAFPVLPHNGTFFDAAPYGLGEARVFTLTLLIFTALSGWCSCGVVITKFSPHSVTFRSSPTVLADTLMSRSTSTHILSGKPPRAMWSGCRLTHRQMAAGRRTPTPLVPDLRFLSLPAVAGRCAAAIAIPRCAYPRAGQP
jgi:hypothetical protein